MDRVIACGRLRTLLVPFGVGPAGMGLRGPGSRVILGRGAREPTRPRKGGKDLMTTVTKQERAQVDKANASGRAPVVFVPGLWLLPSSWDRWARLFEGAGFATVSPGWPDDPDTVEEAKAHPEVFAKKSVGQVADHFDAVIQGLKKKPAVVGHSFGGLMTEILAGRGLAAASVA